MEQTRFSGQAAGSGSHGDSSPGGPKIPPSQSSLGDRLSKTAQSARSETAEAAASISSNVKEAASTASRAIKQEAAEFASDVGHEISKTAEAQKARGVGAIQCFARAIHAAAAELEGQSPLVAQYVRDAAQRVEGLSSNIESRDVKELMEAASDLARSQPLWFFGSTIAAGFALSRFLKSSARTQHPEEQFSAHESAAESPSTAPGMSAF